MKINKYLIYLFYNEKVLDISYIYFIIKNYRISQNKTNLKM